MNQPSGNNIIKIHIRYLTVDFKFLIINASSLQILIESGVEQLKVTNLLKRKKL